MTTPVAVPGARLQTLLAARGGLLGQAGLVAGAHGAQQVVRLGTNVVLARLLAPELLGTMLIINTLRTGGELLTDVGIGQSIVSNPRGSQPSFYNTAWVIQILRGIVLFLAALALTVPLSRLYDSAGLAPLIPVAALIFVIAGWASPARFLLQKTMQVRKLAGFDLAITLATAAVNIALALISPTIWALVVGLLISTAISSAASFFLIDWRSHRLAMNALDAREIVRFGKWIFASSLIYFLAMNFDRLYFAKAIPVALLGVYGVARTYSEAVMLLMQRMGSLIVFPRIAASSKRGVELRGAIAPTRGLGLLAIAALVALGVALSDQAIFLLYDERYHAAAFILPVLLIGAWFAILASFAEATLLGVGLPANVTLGNAAKLAWILVLLPLALAGWGVGAAIAVYVAGDVVRYLALAVQKRRADLSFLRQDLACTIAFVGMIVALRYLAWSLGLAGDLEQWWQGGAMLHG